MTALDTPAIEPRPRRRRRRLVVPALLVLIIMGATIGASLYRHYTSPEYIRTLVVKQLEKAFKLPVHIAGAEFGFFRGTTLTDVRISAKQQGSAADVADGDSQEPLLRINRLEVEHDPFSLLFGRFRVRRASLDSPVVNLVPGPDHPLRDFSLPKRKKRDKETELPALDLSNVRINLLRALGEPSSLTLSLRGREGGDGIYDIVWQRPGKQPETGRLQIDFQQGVLRASEGGTPWFAAETVAAGADFVGPQVGEWIKRLGLRGEVRATEFTIPFKKNAETLVGAPVPRAVVECRDAFVSIPIAEVENSLPPDRRYLRFADIAGEIKIIDQETTASVSAILHGSPVEVSVQMPVGLSDLENAATAGFSAKASARDVRFPQRGANAPEDEARFVQLVPRFTRFYDEYNPEGLVDVELSLSRAQGEGQPIMLDHALFHATEASANTKYFPYPIQNVTGFVEFTSTGVYIRDMCGSREGGKACLNGWIANTKRCAATALEIIVENILIDEELFTGLGPKRAWIRERFNPAGRVDATVINYRPQCDPEKPAKWFSEVDIFPQECSATYSGLPYPVNEITGHLEVLEDGFTVELSGEAGDAPVIIAGRGGVSDRKVTDVDLRVVANALPLDQQLLDALPPKTAAEVAAFHAQGSIDLDSHITSGETAEKVVHRTAISLNGISVQHERVPLPIQSVTGELSIEPGGIHLSNVSGRYKEARIAVAGDLPHQPEEGRPSADELVVGVENLIIDANVHAAVPNGLQKVLDTWHVGGPLDARIVGTRPPSSGALACRGEVLFDNNTVQPSFLNGQFRKVHGVIRFDADQVVAKDIEGVYGDAPVIANFIVQNKDGASRGDVKLLAYGLSVPNEVLSLLPQGVRDTFRRMGAAGKVDLQIDRLTYVQRSPQHERLWNVQAGVRFNDAAIPAIGGLRRILGTATVNGSLGDAQGGTSLSGDVQLQHASLFDRDLTELITPWSFARSAGGDGYLSFDQITANVYGGQLSGRSEVQFADHRTEYSVTTVIQGMPLSSFVNAGRRTGGELEARGTVNANLYLTGEAARLDTMRGGGQFEIVDGWLYKLPIILAILNVLELTFDPTEAFDEASAQFFIAGDRVTFRDIVVKGGVLALVGEGVMAIPDLAVDFRLVNVPGQWWARLPLIEDVMKGTVREFVEIRVSGPITQPSVNTQAIPRITNEIKGLFERRQPKRVIAPGP